MEQIFTAQWPWLLCIGLGMGILSGMLGVGAGIIFIPLLVLVLAYTQKAAQGTALLVMVPMALMAGIRYWMNPAIKVNLLVVLLVAAAAVIGANIGSSVAFAVPENILKKIFAGFVIAAGILMMVR